MINVLRAVIREPLTHLVLSGIMLFTGHSMMNPAENSADDVISAEEITKSLEQKAGDPAKLSKEQRAQLIKGLIDYEILYREAKRLGLDHDAMIKDRLVQKARFYLEGQFVPREPDDKVLRAFYEQNKDQYRQSKSITFRQLVIKKGVLPQVKNLIGEGLEESVLLKRIQPYVQRSLLSASFEHANAFGVGSLFGEEFSKNLFEMPQGVWVGPVESSQGWHIVKIEEVDEDGVAEFPKIRRKAIGDWMSQQKTIWVEEQLKALRDQYQIPLELLTETDV